MCVLVGPCTQYTARVDPRHQGGKGWRGRRELAPRRSATQLGACIVGACGDRHTSYTRSEPPPPPPPHTHTRRSPCRTCQPTPFPAHPGLSRRTRRPRCGDPSFAESVSVRERDHDVVLLALLSEVVRRTFGTCSAPGLPVATLLGKTPLLFLRSASKRLPAGEAVGRPANYRRRSDNTVSFFFQKGQGDRTRQV